MQAIGIMMEDTVQAIYRWYYGQKRSAASPRGWKCVLGFVWLLLWLTWTTPVWIYPTAQRSSGQPILPISLLR